MGHMGSQLFPFPCTLSNLYRLMQRKQQKRELGISTRVSETVVIRSAKHGQYSQRKHVHKSLPARKVGLCRL